MQPTPYSEKKWTLLSVCFWTLIKLVIWIFLSWLVSLIIGFSLYIFLGHQYGIAYMRYLTLTQSHYLIHLPALFWLRNPALLDAQLIHFMDAQVITKAEALIESGQAQLQLLQPRYVKLTSIIQTDIPYLIDSITMLLLVTKLIVLRLTVCILFLPAFAIAGCLGLMDGLVQRELRRLRGGRESALLYHRARSLLIPLLCWSGFLYITLPFNINPEQLLLPFAIVFGFAVWLTAKMFKKYL